MCGLCHKASCACRCMLEVEKTAGLAASVITVLWLLILSEYFGLFVIIYYIHQLLVWL